MISHLCALALLAPFANALTINTPTDLTSGGSATFTWTTTSGDPVFSLELVNEAFHDTFAIANNVDSNLQTLTLTLPAVPARDGYTLEAVNITNINQVFATSGAFSIALGISSSSAASTSLTTSVSTSVSTSVAVVTGSSSPTSGFGTTFSNTPTSGSATSNTGSGTSSAPSVTPSSFNGNGAASNGFGSWFAMLFAALAGGVVAL